MRIKIKSKHKSIIPPCEIELPNFSVITGKNGSGKTHFLEALADVQKSEIVVENQIIKNIRYIGFNGLNPTIEESCNPQAINQYIKTSWENYKHRILQWSHTEDDSLIQLFSHSHEDQILGKFLKKILQETNKPIRELTEDDFANNFDVAFVSSSDFLTAQFALIFKNYQKRVVENQFNEFYQSQGISVTQPVLTKIEFEKKFGLPPWDFINRILKETNIPYETNSPVGTRVESNFTFKMQDINTGVSISPADLSTGEKVLMSLALAIYNTSGNLGKPELLLIDEPDAALHPSMSKLMVDVLNSDIVLNNKIPTIITSHSPTTIIASEGVSIFQIIRGSSTLIKIPIQQAVEMLSSDIPFLRISTEKRRQVFVESKYDVNYYELLSNIYLRTNKLLSEPIFLSATGGNGSNCNDVINIVTNLSKHGNFQVFGIIDWDTKNVSNDKVKVLGENDRYAIENYLLDPLLMGILFIREGKRNFTDFGVSSCSTYSEINNIAKSDCQLIINTILEDLNLTSTNYSTSEIQNGWSLTLTDEFKKYPGHSLETLYKSKYNFLGFYRREDALKTDIIKKVINDYPQFTPVQVFEVLTMIK